MEKEAFLHESVPTSSRDLNYDLNEEQKTLHGGLSTEQQMLEGGMLTGQEPLRDSLATDNAEEALLMLGRSTTLDSKQAELMPNMQLTQVLIEMMENMNIRLCEVERTCAEIRSSTKIMEEIICTETGCGVAKTVPTPQPPHTDANKQLRGDEKPATIDRHRNKGKEVDEANESYIVLGGSDEEPDLESFDANIFCTPNVGAESDFPASIAEYAKALSHPKVRVIDIDEEKLLQGATRNYRKLAHSKQRASKSPSTIKVVGKKLFISPAQPSVPPKKRRADTDPVLEEVVANTHEWPGQRPAIRVHAPSFVTKGKAYTVPRMLKCKFCPTLDMKLTLEACHVCLYVFGSNLDDREMLFKNGNFSLTRSDLQCLCPGKNIDPKILMAMSIKTSWTQRNSPTLHVWSLPPYFGEEVLGGLQVDDILGKYGPTWMKPSSHLKYIYVPLVDQVFHWFLMVISIPERRLYQLDSFPEAGRVPSKDFAMRAVAMVLDEILKTKLGLSALLDDKPPMDKWPVCEARGVTNCGESFTSPLWLLQWLHMEYYFTPNHVGELKPNKVRMHTVVELIRGPHNEIRDIVEARAATTWNALVPPDQ